MRPGDAPELADTLFTLTLRLTPAEHAEALRLADREGMSVEELHARITREVLQNLFGGERREGNVVPFEPLKRGDT